MGSFESQGSGLLSPGQESFLRQNLGPNWEGDAGIPLDRLFDELSNEGGNYGVVVNGHEINGDFDQIEPKHEVNGLDLNYEQFQPMHFQQVPPVVPSLLSTDDYSGPHQFEVNIVPNDGKNPWVYSPSLNKIFIDMSSHFPVDFKVSDRNAQLYVRLTPIFALNQHAQDLVYRCMQHEHVSLNRDIPDHVRQHIIRCENQQTRYYGSKDRNERLNLVFPLAHPQTGTDCVRESFVFVCKNSCPSGMNRRPIQVIFTLENNTGVILGRRVLNVRICSCPKRDKEKEEKDSLGPGKHGKKRKIEKKPPSDIQGDVNKFVVTIPIIGKGNRAALLTYAHDLMAGEIIRKGHSNSDAYKQCISEINTIINKPPSDISH